MYADVSSMMVNVKVLSDIVVNLLLIGSDDNCVTVMRNLNDAAGQLVAAVHQQ